MERKLDAKVGPVVASRICDEIALAGWPVGRVLGTERELMERYSVSRGGLREAVRMLEQQGIAEMRPGRAGGLTVSAPDGAGAVDSILQYLRFRRVQPQQIAEARRLVELAFIPIVVDRMNSEAERRIRNYLEEEAQFIAGDSSSPPDAWLRTRKFHIILGSLTGNPLLELFAHILQQLVGHEFSARHTIAESRTILKEVHRCHVDIFEALIRKDATEATRLFSEALEIKGRFYTDPTTRTLDSTYR